MKKFAFFAGTISRDISQDQWQIPKSGTNFVDKQSKILEYSWEYDSFWYEFQLWDNPQTPKCAGIPKNYNELNKIKITLSGLHLEVVQLSGI